MGLGPVSGFFAVIIAAVLGAIAVRLVLNALDRNA
jgi:hypothetical protein